MRDVIALCWYVPWLQEGGQVRLVVSASIIQLGVSWTAESLNILWGTTHSKLPHGIRSQAQKGAVFFTQILPRAHSAFGTTVKAV